MKRLAPLDAIVSVTVGEGRPMLVGRPHGVTHLYVGPLTRTGMVPSKRRPVCSARTRRLYDRMSFPVRGELLMCARCSARVAGSPLANRVEHLPSSIGSMAEDRKRYQALSVVDLFLSIRFAETEEELAQCAVAMELGFTRDELLAEHTSPTGRTFSNLPAVLERTRARRRPRQQLYVPAQFYRRPMQDPTYRAAVEHAERNRPQRRIA